MHVLCCIERSQQWTSRSVKLFLISQSMQTKEYELNSQVVEKVSICAFLTDRMVDAEVGQ